MSAKHFTLLESPWCKPCRPLPVALGQLIANTAAGKVERHALLAKLYAQLSPVDKIRCRDETQWCRAAKRGGVEARVA